MENYESLGTIGEGTYGVVLKCRHKATGQIVAIKKFKESDDDEQVKKTALREIKILKQLKHENIVSLLEVFRVKGKLYLVFEYVEKTILEEIEKNPEGLDPLNIKRLMWQLVRAIHFCHQHNIIHRDIKPENLLVSRNGVLKLCDFGFARPLAGAGAKYTEYVSTRWYRAPELLVGDVSYGKAVDVWSIGCMFAEIATGLPLFPGDSDIDQLYHIIKCLGRITPRQHELFKKNSLYVGVKLPHATEREPLDSRFPQFDRPALDLLKQTIQDEPLDRWTCAELLNHPFFENATELFERELQDAIQRDHNDTMSLRKKRTRSQKPPPSRGTNAGSHNADDYSSGDSPYYANPSQALKPTFKPMVVAAAPHKDKPHVVVPKKLALGLHGFGSPTTGGGGGGGGGGGLVLPTLSSMTPSSSSTSTASIDSTATMIPPSCSQIAPVNTSKKVGSVLPMPSPPENHSDSSSSYPQNPPRMSLTSHGARPTIPGSTLYPSAVPTPSSPFHSSLVVPQRPPPSQGKHSSGSGNSTPSGAKHLRVFPAGALKAAKTQPPASTLQSSMEIYSPSKKSHASHSSNSQSTYGTSFPVAAKKTHTGGQAATVTPLQHGHESSQSSAYYVPPKTSHGAGAARRAHHTHAAVSPAPKQRRADHDSYRNY